jgi:14-3-3 protein epsilon
MAFFEKSGVSREQLVFLARTANAAERYDEMRSIIKILVEKVVPEGGCPDDLTVDERNLLATAYKNATGVRRTARRTIEAVIQEEAKEDGNPNKKMGEEYIKLLEKELEDLCHEVLVILAKRLLQANKGKSGAEFDEVKAYYLKMAADYHRYLAEFKNDKDNQGKALSYYKEGLEVAQKSLPVTHAVRLGVALNYAVCLYEIAKQPKEACALIQTTYDDAQKEMANKKEEEIDEDTKLIVQMLKDNLSLWKSEAN